MMMVEYMHEYTWSVTTPMRMLKTKYNNRNKTDTAYCKEVINYYFYFIQSCVLVIFYFLFFFSFWQSVYSEIFWKVFYTQDVTLIFLKIMAYKPTSQSQKQRASSNILEGAINDRLYEPYRGKQSVAIQFLTVFYHCVDEW